MSDPLLTVRDAAAFLGISVGAFYKLRARHRIPSRGVGRSLRFYKGDLVTDYATSPEGVAESAERMRTIARDWARQHHTESVRGSFSARGRETPGV
jgi:excisionase family DNA binding protein